MDDSSWDGLLERLEEAISGVVAWENIVLDWMRWARSSFHIDSVRIGVSRGCDFITGIVDVWPLDLNRPGPSFAIELKVSDKGGGFSPGSSASRLSLIGMRGWSGPEIESVYSKVREVFPTPEGWARSFGDGSIVQRDYDLLAKIGLADAVIEKRWGPDSGFRGDEYLVWPGSGGELIRSSPVAHEGAGAPLWVSEINPGIFKRKLREDFIRVREEYSQVSPGGPLPRFHGAPPAHEGNPIRLGEPIFVESKNPDRQAWEAVVGKMRSEVERVPTWSGLASSWLARVSAEESVDSGRASINPGCDLITCISTGRTLSVRKYMPHILIFLYLDKSVESSGAQRDSRHAALKCSFDHRGEDPEDLFRVFRSVYPDASSRRSAIQDGSMWEKNSQLLTELGFFPFATDERFAGTADCSLSAVSLDEAGELNITTPSDPSEKTVSSVKKRVEGFFYRNREELDDIARYYQL